MNRIRWICIFPLAILIAAVSASSEEATPVYGYDCLAVYPHDPSASTQGLICADSVFYESTGLLMSSSLRKVEIETGLVIKRHDVPHGTWAEGMTSLRDTLYQLTYLNHIGFEYVERDTFELIETFDYPWEGWGLTHDGVHLIASDGSDTLRFLDPHTHEQIARVAVQDMGQPVRRLNELEWIQGRVYANVAPDDRIAVIHPASGQVEAWVDLGGLRDSIAGYPQAGVLNGIAFDPERMRIFVTGKLWPRIFQVDVPTLHSAAVEPSMDGRIGLELSPSPCRGTLMLRMELPGAGPVSVQLLDLQGRLERILMEGRWPAGTRVTTLRIERMPPGVHLLRVVTPRSVETRKVMALR
jgi:glutaminyl-peptide cyclotransferase